jgi:hypothetical protein
MKALTPTPVPSQVGGFPLFVPVPVYPVGHSAAESPVQGPGTSALQVPPANAICIGALLIKCQPEIQLKEADKMMTYNL